MRDYSFGNFISAMRERSGLSQYQLGALVGVSDKAVSKWENGVSKPRLSTVRRLAEVFDVSVDELLTCEYATFKEERKDLFTMKNKILRDAKIRLERLYGANPPLPILNRFETESLMLDGRENLLWMGFMGRFQEMLSEQGAYYESREVKGAASFIAWILGGTNVNPLPAHYYCPSCKKVEFSYTAKCGLDLPDKNCSCGEKFKKDGFKIDEIHMNPFFKSNEVLVSCDAMEQVKTCLQEYFQGYGKIKEIRIQCNEDLDALTAEKLAQKKYALLSKDMESFYPDEVITMSREAYFESLGKLSILTVVQSSKMCISNQDIADMEFSEKQIKDFYDYIVKHGLFDGYDLEELDLKQTHLPIEVPKFSDLIAIYGLSRSVGVWAGNEEYIFKNGVPWEDLITNREDLYEQLRRMLNGNYVTDISALLFEVIENVRKGKYCYRPIPADIEAFLLEGGVPAWYLECMKKIKYLYPKTLLVLQIKRDICQFFKQQGNEN